MADTFSDSLQKILEDAASAATQVYVAKETTRDTSRVNDRPTTVSGTATKGDGMGGSMILYGVLAFVALVVVVLLVRK